MNFVYISPNFPEAFRWFCIRLKGNGVNVLGVGDAPYDNLHPDLKWALTEYYRVSSLEDYDQVLRALGYFTGRYGKIDWVESNNEYWLEMDAALRTDFNILTGLKAHEIGKYKSKLAMKAYYQEAGIPVARCAPVTSPEAGFAFAREVGYPIIVKPDNGVGAIATWKLGSDRDMAAFFENPPDQPYLMEEFVPGLVTTYDGVCNSKGEVLFAASHISRVSIMDMVNEHAPTYYYVDKEMPKDIEAAGKATLKAFGAASRFFHLEFFRLTEDKPGLGKKGGIVALEVNMRPAGGFTPDMLNFSQSVDVYQIWADMVAYDEIRHQFTGPKTYCVNAGRRDENRYVYTAWQLAEKYKSHIRMQARMPEALSVTMGNEVILACFDTLAEVEAFAGKAFAVVAEEKPEDAPAPAAGEAPAPAAEEKSDAAPAPAAGKEENKAPAKRPKA